MHNTQANLNAQKTIRNDPEQSGTIQKHQGNLLKIVTESSCLILLISKSAPNLSLIKPKLTPDWPKIKPNLILDWPQIKPKSIPK